MKPVFVLDIKARFDWPTPPATEQETIIRGQANDVAQLAANRLNKSIELIILEFIQSHMEKK